MKRAALAAMLAAMMLGSTAHGSHGGSAVVVSGQIMSMAPGTKQHPSLGLTEGQNPCGRFSPDLGDLQGVDGWWIELPPGPSQSTYVGHAATLEHSSVDMDVWFYDADCELVTATRDPAAYDMATDLDAGRETGTIPRYAAWAIVDQSVGAGGTFMFTIAGDAPA